MRRTEVVNLFFYRGVGGGKNIFLNLVTDAVGARFCERATMVWWEWRIPDNRF